MKSTAAILPFSKIVMPKLSLNTYMSDKIIIFILFLYFFSYPFVIRNLMPVVYSLALNVLLALAILVCALNKVPILKVKYYCNNKVLKLGILFYGFYFFVLIIVSFLNFQEPVIVFSLANKIRSLIFAIIIFYLLSNRGLLHSLCIYIHIFTICSVLGLMLILLNYFGVIHPVTEVDINNFPGGPENIRLFYGIGFIWPNTWLGSPFGLERLQSFTDEAGTFAFGLLPAILLASYWRMKFSVLVMVAALIFTFSFGAILIFLLISILNFITAILNEGINIKRLFNLLLILTGFILIVNYLPFDLLEKFNIYSSAKYTSDGGTETSLGQRIAGLEIALKTIASNPLGFGSNSAGLFLNFGDAALAIGWLNPLIEAGVIGWVNYVLAFGLVLVHCLRNIIFSNGIKRLSAIIILVNGYAAFQRSGIDSNIWHLFWLILYLRLVAMNPDAVASFDFFHAKKINKFPLI